MIQEENQNPEEENNPKQFKDSDISPEQSREPQSPDPTSNPSDDVEGMDYSKGDSTQSKDNSENEVEDDGKKYNRDVKENHPHEIENGDQDGLNPYPDELDPTIKK